jgi:WD40 repeat protein
MVFFVLLSFVENLTTHYYLLGRARLWDICKSQGPSKTVAELHTDGPVKLLHLDPYKMVTGVPSDDQVHVWETRTGDLLNTLSCSEPAKSAVRSTMSAMAVDGCRIAMAGTSAGGGSFVHYRDFLKSSVPVSLPGKEVSKFWRPQGSDENAR